MNNISEQLSSEKSRRVIMDKVITAACVVIIALIVVEGIAVTSASGATGAQSAYNKAAWTAKQFVTNDDTYKYDGMSNTLRVSPDNGAVSIMDAPRTQSVQAMAQSPSGQTYTFKIKFNSKHAGYGNRNGKVLADTITPHTALITVKGNQVISATMDGKWDMRTNKPI